MDSRPISTLYYLAIYIIVLVLMFPVTGIHRSVLIWSDKQFSCHSCEYSRLIRFNIQMWLTERVIISVINVL